MGDALYLHYEDLARDALGGKQETECAVVAYRKTRVAVLFWSKTDPHEARVGVVNVSPNGVQRVSSPVFTPLVTASTTEGQVQTHPRVWGGAWSPDGRLLIVYGPAPRASDGKLDAAVWILTKNEWIDDDSSVSSVSETPPQVLQVSPRDLLASDAPWRSSSSKSVSMGVCGAIFHAKSGSRCFLATEDGWLLKMEIQVAPLLVLARSHARPGDATAHVKISSVTRLTNWHAGVTAVAYEATTSTLVLSGGLKNPSEELRAQGASSLSTWRVNGEDPFVELLDYTMVMGPHERTTSRALDSSHDSADNVAAPQASGIVKKMKHSFLNPLKLLNGDDEDDGPMLPGTIRELAISPDGVFLSIVDRDGQFRVRQIDACADVLPWQYVQGRDSATPSPVETVTWVGPSSLAFLTRDHQLTCGFLASSEDMGECEGDGEYSAGLNIQIVMQHIESDQYETPASEYVLRKVSVWTNLVDDGADDVSQFHVHELCVHEFSASMEWRLSHAANVSSSGLVQLLVDSHQFDRALDLVYQCQTRGEWVGNAIDLDHVYQQMWVRYRAGAAIRRDEIDVAVLDTENSRDVTFEKALSLLNSVEHDKKWIVNECLQIMASSSFYHMKEILASGLRALIAVPSGGNKQHEHEHNEDRSRLLRHLYRLDTLNEIIISELDEEERRSVADEQCFDGAEFAVFRDASILDVALECAKEGRVDALRVLFRRNGYNLMPYRTQILDLLPTRLPPHAYCRLLPAIGLHPDEEWQFYTLVSNESGYDVVEAQLLAENRTHDVTVEELQVFEDCAKKEPSERRDEYALWYTHRMVELDSMYGQLANACALGRCGYAALLVASDDEGSGASPSSTAVVSSTPFEEFIEHSERLHKCVFELHMVGCRDFLLENWSLLSLHDQALIVVVDGTQGPVGTVDDLLHRLRVVFLKQRRHDFALDEIISWLCQVLMTGRNSPGSHDPLLPLELCAQLIHHSNPANSPSYRWIQDDARLLRTAIDIVYAATTVGVDDQVKIGGDVRKRRHQVFVDQLWLIFQSLPERKPDDPEGIAQLQVEVDGMEDFLVAMDVLANYEILTSPSELRHTLAQEVAGGNPASESVGLVEKMCVFGLSRNVPWTSIWQDALKLKTHVFGERVSQEAMLAVLLRQLIGFHEHQPRDDSGSFLSDAHNLISNWVTANISALSIPMEILLEAVRARIDADSQEKASQLVSLAQSTLDLPAIAESDEARPFVTEFQSIMDQEENHVKVRELFELLTYGAVKITRTQLRDLHSEKDRLDLLLRVFMSNPSNYKMSAKCQVWLREELRLQHDHAQDIVLDGVLHLARLLQVRQSHDVDIVLKAAYSALYCLDYDTAHRLASDVIAGSQGALCGQKGDESESDRDQHGETKLVLLSLVLDLVSASSFRSWEKKASLVKALLSVDDAALWAHPIADLLFERLHKLEAVQALAAELGLTENDLEERREQERKRSADDVLLKELELVVDLLREDSGQKPKEDREFVLRLLQKGFQLVVLTQTQTKSPLVPASPTSQSRARSASLVQMENENDEYIARVVPQMAVIAFQEAHRRLTHGLEDGWEAMMEIGFSYLLLLSSNGESSDALVRVWVDEVAPLCSRQVDARDQLSFPGDATALSTHELFVQRFHHFFLFLSASSSAMRSSLDLTSLRDLLKKLEYSHTATQEFLQSQPEGEVDGFDDEEIDATSERPQRRDKTCDEYATFAKQCLDMMHSQKTTQELEAVSTFLNDDVDLEQFSVDSEYRLATIRRMSIKKEHLLVAREFASKYGIDEYECVLAYIWHAFFPVDGETRRFTRQEQLEQAFRGSDDPTGGDDFLEQALQRPLEFGEFLLRPMTGVYECLSGADHVGILLVLRMILECSKRIGQTEDAAAVEVGIPLPLPKSSSDRVTLLFMCLKRLKEVSGSNGPDFKLVCSARTTNDLLHGAENADESRSLAMGAIAPFLNGKTIKMLTKVLQKLHQMSSSAIVMVYLDDMLSKIWEEQQARGITPNADLAAYAYESCMPYRSVLSIDHLLLFHRRFVRAEQDEDVSGQFYGQNLAGLTHFGALLSSSKRMHVISENYTLFESRVEALRSTNPTEDVIEMRGEQLRALEEELVESAFWFIVDCVEQMNLFTDGSSAGRGEWLFDWKTRMKSWFVLDSAGKAQEEDRVLNAFVAFCERVESLDVATLLVEMALGLISPPEFVARAVQDIYCKGVSDVIHKALTSEGSEILAEGLVTMWATKLAPSLGDDFDHPALQDLRQYISTLEPHDGELSPASLIHPSDGVYRDILGQLDGLAPPSLHELIKKRKEKLEQVGGGEEAAESTSLRMAVVSQWKSVIAQYEEQQNWMTSALLSHVLLEGTRATSEDSEYDFGLRVKAVCKWLSHHHHEGAWSEILDAPTMEIHAQFEPAIFDKLLAIVEHCSGADGHLKSAQQLTIGVASILRCYEELSGAFDSMASQNAWACEKEKALAARLSDGFGITRSGENGDVSPGPSAKLWSALLVRGCWDERLMMWYTFVAFDKLTPPKVVAEYVRMRGDANPALAIMLLLVSPFEELRIVHQTHILSGSRQLLLSPTTSASTKARLLELLLLRVDVAILLQVDGLEAVLLSFYTESAVGRKTVSWTSTAEYYVCRLVVLGQYAAASRLVCALWNVHPMLWDLENARLVLGNYLHALVKQSSAYGNGAVVGQARGQAYDHYKRELL